MTKDTSNRVAMWQTYVQTAENTSNRREATHRYMVPVHLAIFAAHLVREFAEPVHVWVSFAGVAMGVLWLILLHSHYTVNKAKYAIIRSLERELPRQPFTEESELIGIDSDRLIFPGLANIQHWGVVGVVIAHAVIALGFSYWW